MQATMITSDQVEVTLAGREFGGQETPTSQFQRECPEGLRVVVNELTKQSALAKLDESSDDLTKQAVFEAYASDLQLLQRYVNDFESCVKSAARASIMADSKEDEANKETDAMWQELEQQLPPISRQRPLLALPNTLAAKGAADILHDLKLQFADSVQHIIQLFTYCLHVLTEEEIVGLMEWNDVDVGRYHYFCRVAKERMLNETHHDEVRGTEEKRVRERTMHRQRFFERHIHHLVDARRHSLDDYKMGIPPRVSRFLASVPAWLKPQLQVVDGQMTMEEVFRRMTGDKQEVDRDVVATFIYDPTICLGDFVLVGWSGKEVQTIQKQGSDKDEAKWLFMALAIVGVIFVTTCISLFIGASTNLSSREAVEKATYATYLNNAAPVGARTGGRNVKEARQFDPLEIEGANSQLLFGWYTPHSLPSERQKARPASITILRTIGKGNTTQQVSFILEHREFISPYGDINLAPRFNLPVTLQVIEVQQANGIQEKDVLKYRVSYNQ